MAEFLKLKKSNCKNCYKCIRHCPVKSIRFSGNQAHIVGNECILCGQCFVVCPQNAKEIADGTEMVKVLIASGDPVYVSMAPSFIANYDGVGINQMDKALKLIGFAGAEETAIGATMVKKEYERIILEEKKDILITSCCHSVNLLIQKHYPRELQYLADVLSPMQAHAMDIKKRHPGAKVVFIGPCVAKKDEADYYKGYADAVLTYEELTNWLSAEGITLEKDIESTEKSRARLFPTAGGVLKTMFLQGDEERNDNSKYSEYTYMAVDGVENCIAALKDIEEGHLHKCVIEMSACAGSCIGGPVMEKYHRSPIRDYQTVTKYAGKEDFDVASPTETDMQKNIEYIDRKLKMPGEDEIAAIMKKMGKIHKEDELNCGSCGYNSCREKAIAIIQGKAEVSMCLPYLKDRAETFSDNIIKNTPNGIVVLNENLEVQQINKAALKLMNIERASNVLGEQVIRILDPKPFLDVQSSGRSVHDRRVYLAEYNKYVEQSILYDRDYNILILIMKNVTEEEAQRKQKEKLESQTVETADKVIDNQMRIVQEIASLLGETAAETKIALEKLKGMISDE